MGAVRACLAVVAVVVGASSCADVAGVSRGLAHVAMQPHFTEDAAAAYVAYAEAGLVINNLRIVLSRPGSSSPVVDTTISSLTPAQLNGDSAIRVDMTIELTSAEETMGARIEMRDGTTVVMEGTRNITARAGAQIGQPPLVEMTPAVGLTTRSVVISPRDTTIAGDDNITFVGTALDADGVEVLDLPIQCMGWHVSDTTLGTIPVRGGDFVGKGRQGTARVVLRTCELPNGVGVLADTVTVTLLGVPSAITIVQGDNQTAIEGKTVAVAPRIRVTDGTSPIPGLPVAFAIVTGGGTVTGADAVTNADGVATVGSWRLGPTVGSQTLRATAGTLTATFTAQALESEASLAIGTQPGGAHSGDLLSPQPVIEIRDALGAVSDGSTLMVTASIASGNGTLSGTTSVAAVGGVATFTDLRIAGAGTFTLAFSAGALPAATSESFTIIGDPVSLAISSHFELMVKGTTRPMTVTINDASGAPLADVPTTFVSRTPGIVTVSPTGVITGAAKGRTVLVAHVTGNAQVSDSVLVVVAETNGPALISSITSFSVKADTTFTVSVYIDMLQTGKRLSSALVEMRWDPVLLAFQDTTARTGAPAVTLNADSAASGVMRLALADVQGFTGRVELLRLRFRANSAPGITGGFALVAKEINASDFTELLPLAVQVSHTLITR